MIQKLSTILILTLGLCQIGKSQATEIRVNFGRSGSGAGEYHYSPKEAIDASNNAGFIGITGYCKQPFLTGEVAFRIHTNEGWQAWQGMELYHEVELEERTVYEGKPIQVSFDSIQFSTTNKENKEWIFRLFFPEGREGGQQFNTESTNAGCPLPAYCDRYCWGENDCPADSTPTSTIPTHLIVHHSAGFNSSANYKDVVSYYWDFHVNTNGWDDIGYNWLIDPNGVIYEGRGSGVQASHFSCMNTYTLGICLIGNFETQDPTDTAIGSLLNMLAYEASTYNIDPDGMSVHATSQLNLFNVSGHRDGNSATVGCPKGTVCPGDSLYDMLPEIRQRLAAKACMQGVGVEEENVSTWKVYPNPAKEMIEIIGTEEIERISIVEPSGKEISLEMIGEGIGKYRVNIGALQEGMYLLKIEGKDSVEILKLMKRK